MTKHAEIAARLNEARVRANVVILQDDHPSDDTPKRTHTEVQLARSVLTLLDEITRLEAEVEYIQQQAHYAITVYPGELVEAKNEITRLEAELGIAVDVAKRTAAALEKTCEREEAQRKIIDEEQEESAMWADKSNVMEAQLGEALAEIATLKEALAECRHALVTATANGSKLRFPRTVEKADAALATPTATAREES